MAMVVTMNCHVRPKDDAWKQVTIARQAADGNMLWMLCECGREIYVDPLVFAREKNIDPETPLFSVGAALRCTRCGEKKVRCRPRPYSIATRGS